MNPLFNLYTNASEYQPAFPDLFGRARFYGARNADILDPVVSRAIQSTGFAPHYPDNKPFAVCVSHDIDHLFVHQTGRRRLLNAGKAIAKGRLGHGFSQLGKIARNSIHAAYDLNRLAAINNRHKIRSTYYFLSLRQGEEDFNYDPAAIAGQFKAVADSGGEIGLHGGHRAYNNLDKLLQEKQLLEHAIGKPVLGYRNHFLRFELPVTWNNLEQAGIGYDTTLGYADCVGFRNGMCYPFHPYDIRRQTFLDIVELPLVVMDATIFFYMRMDPSVAFGICRQLIDNIRECKGVLTLLWHNNFLDGEMGAFYLRLLDHLQNLDPWFATSLELVDWWKDQHLLEQSTEGLQELFKKDFIDKTSI